MVRATATLSNVLVNTSRALFVATELREMTTSTFTRKLTVSLGFWFT